MKIYSPFFDYYDSVMSLGVADDLIYIRKTTKITIKNDKSLRYYSGPRYDPDTDIGFSGGYALIGFCGQWYPQYKQKGIWYYKYEDIPQEITRRKRFYRWDSRWWQEKFFNPEHPYSELNYLFEQSPIVNVYPYDRKSKSYTVILNDRLNRYDFQKVKDPYTAYQMIFQYLANKASPEKPIPQNLTDSQLAEIKGFNKYSFRKDKQPKGSK